MTYEAAYKHLCVILLEYDTANGSHSADDVIAHPERWVGTGYLAQCNPFYASAAALLIEARAKLDVKTTPRSRLSAITRIVKNCPDSRPSMCGIFTYGDRFVVCDGYRLIRMKEDIASLPHVKCDFDVNRAMKDTGPTEETLHLPTVGDLRAFMAENKVKFGKKIRHKPYHLDNFIWCDPKFLIDMIQALPECVAYKPANAKSQIYFAAPNGDDGILCPVYHSEE